MRYNQHRTLLSASLSCINNLRSSSLHVVCRVLRQGKSHCFPSLRCFRLAVFLWFTREPYADTKTGVEQRRSRRYLSKLADDAKRSSGSVCTLCDGQTIDCLPSVYLYFRCPLRSIWPPKFARCTCPIETPSIALIFRCCGMAN